jgi:DNA-directed RNA polymerase specialized sigma24 family protein
MKKGWALTKEALDLLLEWLSADREKAGSLYEEIRSGLVRLFLIRGCRNPEVLADETINRVTLKLPTIIDRYEGDPIHYFYSIAKNVYLENRALQQKREEQLDTVLHSKFLVASSSSDDANIQLDYLKICLQELSVDDRDLIIEYFAVDKSAKFEHRRLMSERRGISLNGLRIRVLRSKKRLQECISTKML